MTLPLFNGEFEIENLCNASAERMRLLREVLSRPASVTGVTVNADNKRPGFFDLQAFGRIFFVHVSPMRAKIHLLAVWKQKPANGIPQELISRFAREDSWTSIT